MYIIIFILAMLVVVFCHIRLAPKIKNHINYAGWHKPEHYIIFVTISITAIAFGLLWTLYRISQVPPHTTMTFFKVLGLLAPLLVAVLLPFLLLYYYEQQYQLKLRKEAAYIINFIIIYLEAGYTIDQSLENLLVILQRHKFAFARELLITWYDLRYLGNRSLAWQRMLDRLGDREWLFFVRLLQKEELYDRYLIDSFVRDSDTINQMRLATIEFNVAKSTNYAIVVAWIFFLPVLAIMLLGPFIAYVLSR